MAMKDKAMFSVELDKHMMSFLEEMVKQYDLPDSSKALRVLITYALDPRQTAIGFFPTSAALTANRLRGMV